VWTDAVIGSALRVECGGRGGIPAADRYGQHGTLDTPLHPEGEYSGIDLVRALGHRESHAYPHGHLQGLGAFLGGQGHDVHRDPLNCVLRISQQRRAVGHHASVSPAAR
jgi:hypothetical protein